MLCRLLVGSVRAAPRTSVAWRVAAAAVKGLEMQVRLLVGVGLGPGVCSGCGCGCGQLGFVNSAVRLSSGMQVRLPVVRVWTAWVSEIRPSQVRSSL
jgi:hypothetical protein